MGQRTRMGRAKTGGKPISRHDYRNQARWKLRQAAGKHRELVEAGQLPTDNHGGRMRFMAKHAAAPWVTYTRTEQSHYSGPKSAPPAVAAAAALPSFRRIGSVWQLIAALAGR